MQKILFGTIVVKKQNMQEDISRESAKDNILYNLKREQKALILGKLCSEEMTKSNEHGPIS